MFRVFFSDLTESLDRHSKIKDDPCVHVVCNFPFSLIFGYCITFLVYIQELPTSSSYWISIMSLIHYIGFNLSEQNYRKTWCVSLFLLYSLLL